MNVRTILLLCVFIGICRSSGSDEYFEHKYVLENSEFPDGFGATIEVDNETAVILGDNTLHIYDINETQLALVQTVDEESPLSGFGLEVHLHQNKLVTSAPMVNNGEVYLYENEESQWIQEDILLPPIENIHNFGTNIAVYEEFMFITGQELYSDIPNFKIFTYQRSGDSIQYTGQLETPEGAEGFGVSFSINGNVAYIGSHWDDNADMDNVGSVYSYLWNGSQWLYQNRIELVNPTAGANFGHSVVAKNNLLFIGAPYYSSQDIDLTGAVFVFEEDNMGVEEIAVLTPFDYDAYDCFGDVIDFRNETLVIGARSNQDAGSGSGSAYLFKNLNSIWSQYKKICPSDLESGDVFGSTTAINDNIVFIGSPLKDNFTGAVYLFNPHENTLHSNFAANIVNGSAPLPVQLTDLSQGNPTGWEWDVNSDGIIDSFEQNPVFTFEIDGLYTVTLTVHNDDGSHTFTKLDYIQIMSDIVFCDVSLNGILDVSDIIIIVSFILGDATPTEDQFTAGDVNFSGTLDVQDIIAIVSQILEL